MPVKIEQPARITRPIIRVGDGTNIGWSLYIEDYERAVDAMAESIGTPGSIFGPKEAARSCLAAIGITPFIR